MKNKNEELYFSPREKKLKISNKKKVKFYVKLLCYTPSCVLCLPLEWTWLFLIICVSFLSYLAPASLEREDFSFFCSKIHWTKKLVWHSAFELNFWYLNIPPSPRRNWESNLFFFCFKFFPPYHLSCYPNVYVWKIFLFACPCACPNAFLSCIPPPPTFTAPKYYPVKNDALSLPASPFSSSFRFFFVSLCSYFFFFGFIHSLYSVVCIIFKVSLTYVCLDKQKKISICCENKRHFQSLLWKKNCFFLKLMNETGTRSKIVFFLSLDLVIFHRNKTPI